MNECPYELNIPDVGICCKAYYNSSKRIDGKLWCHFPKCFDINCPLLHPELLEGAKLEGDKIMTFWQIVPKNDGYTYLSRNDLGEHILLKKIDMRRNLGRLTFVSKENTDRYINSNNLSAEYIAEEFMVGPALFKYWQNDYEED